MTPLSRVGVTSQAWVPTKVFRRLLQSHLLIWMGRRPPPWIVACVTCPRRHRCYSHSTMRISHQMPRWTDLVVSTLVRTLCAPCSMNHERSCLGVLHFHQLVYEGGPPLWTFLLGQGAVYVQWKSPLTPLQYEVDTI